jgi:hypothetical protein
MMPIIIKGKSINQGIAKGEAVVSLEPISFLGGLDVDTGKIIEKGHPLEGISIRNKILVLKSSKGSTAGVYSFYEAKLNHKAPKAIITSSKDPIIISAAIESNIPAILVAKEDIERIKSGCYVEVDALRGHVTIINNP